jgi:hypothetical protein
MRIWLGLVGDWLVRGRGPEFWVVVELDVFCRELMLMLMNAIITQRCNMYSAPS